MNAGDDRDGHREELDWTRPPDRLPDLIRDALDEETRGLFLPGAMAQRVIHGGRARRPWGRAQATLLIGLTLVSGAGVVGAAALVPTWLSPDEPLMTAPSSAPSPSPSTPPDPSRVLVVGYVPPGWRQVPLTGARDAPLPLPGRTSEPGTPRTGTPDGGSDGGAPGGRASGSGTVAGRGTPAGVVAVGRGAPTWAVRYEAVRGVRRALVIRVTVLPAGLAEARRAEGRRGAAMRPYPVTAGRAVIVPAAGETRVHWEPRAGLLVSVLGIGATGGQVRRVVAGLRLAG